MPHCLFQIALLRQELGLNFYVTCEQVVRIMECFLVSFFKAYLLIVLGTKDE
jgi:hypothetical protein